MTVIYEIPKQLRTDSEATELELTLRDGTTVEEGTELFLKKAAKGNTAYNARMYLINGRVSPPYTVLQENDRVTLRSVLIGG